LNKVPQFLKKFKEPGKGNIDFSKTTYVLKMKMVAARLRYRVEPRATAGPPGVRRPPHATGRGGRPTAVGGGGED